MKLRAGFLAIVLAASAATADAPTRSLRPVARVDVFPVALPSLAPSISLRPLVRPAVSRVSNFSPKPVSSVTRTTSSGQKIGRICRDRDLQGINVGRVPGKLSGCGIKDAVRLYSVSGVQLSTPVVMECDTAHALKTWMDRGMSRAVGRQGGGVVKVQVAAGYSCRTRNSKPGAKISEHGKGRAIDISAFHLSNGDRISVLKDWGKGKKGRILKQMHGAACGPFGTVLGPNADKYHRDHFHFDIARHRGGAYCR